MRAPVMSSSPAWGTDINVATHRRNAVSITQPVNLHPAPALLQWIISCEHKHPAVRQLDNRKTVPTTVNTCDGRDTGTGLTWHTPKGLQLLEVSWRTLSLYLDLSVATFPSWGSWDGIFWNFVHFSINSFWVPLQISLPLPFWGSILTLNFLHLTLAFLDHLIWATGSAHLLPDS